MTKLFAKESDLVATFCEIVAGEKRWTAYHETGGYDLLLVDPKTGAQVGIEAKLSLNAKVLDQILPDYGYWNDRGPDYRAVLVPGPDLQLHLRRLAHHIGIGILSIYRHDSSYTRKSSWHLKGRLPDNSEWSDDDWPNWCPAERLPLPEYVPDVTGGHAAPVALTHWKIRAIKLLILLERAGSVTRRDMAALRISPTRWCANGYGYLERTPQGYVRCDRTPDLKAQHPVNWAEIEADFKTWAKDVRPDLIGTEAA